MPTRDQVFLRSFGTPPPTLAVDNRPSHIDRVNAMPQGAAIQEAAYTAPMYIGLNLSIAKSYVIHPTNQGQRGAIAQRQVMMIQPRNNPSRSQFQQGYTAPIQLFASSNTWQTPSGRNSKGKRLSQPSLNQVSPFASLPIPTRMPWDL